MFRAGRSRSFKELMFRGALSLICCAIAALCVGGVLSALAENLGPKAHASIPTRHGDRPLQTGATSRVGNWPGCRQCRFVQEISAVGQQMIEFGVIGEFVDPRQVDQEQPTRIISRGIEAIKIHWLASVIGANAGSAPLYRHRCGFIDGG